MYCVRWVGLGRIGMKIIPGDLVLRYDAWLFNHDFHPLKGNPKKKDSKKKRTKKSTYSFMKIRSKASRIFRSFKIKSFMVNLDTDDYVLNGYLFPLFYYLGRKGNHLKINFQGNLEINIIVENRLYKILRAIIF